MYHNACVERLTFQKTQAKTYVRYVNLQQIPPPLPQFRNICTPTSKTPSISCSTLSTLCHCIEEIHFTTKCSFQEVGYLKPSTAYLQKIHCRIVKLPVTTFNRHNGGGDSFQEVPVTFPCLHSQSTDNTFFTKLNPFSINKYTEGS